jgi:ubiquitin C-terminal hydrolase
MKNNCQYNNASIQNDEIINSNKNDDGKIAKFFNSIYLSFKKIIKGDDKGNYNDKILLERKFNESFNYYRENYKNKINYEKQNPENSLDGLINLLNDCYIISFLQILFHTPNFIKILKQLNKSNPNQENIINYLILVSQYPFNVDYFYKFKQLLGEINLEYSKPWANDSQEFGIDLINYIISKTNNQPIEEKEYESKYYNDKEIIQIKKNIYDNYISNKQKNKNDLEEMFLFYQIDILCASEYKKPKISENLSIELTFPNFKNYNIKIEELLDYKYNCDFNDNQIDSNRIIIKSKLASLPNILIISINRCLVNQNIDNTEVIYEETLDLEKYIDTDLFNIKSDKTKYNLYAINECIHFNRARHNICKIKINNKWYIFDDEKMARYLFPINKGSYSVTGLFYIKEN